MAKRLQIMIQDSEFQWIQRAARMRGMSVSDWVRQALANARWAERDVDVAPKLEVIRASALMQFPTANIDRMLKESAPNVSIEPFPMPPALRRRRRS